MERNEQSAMNKVEEQSTSEREDTIKTILGIKLIEEW